MPLAGFEGVGSISRSLRMRWTVSPSHLDRETARRRGEYSAVPYHGRHLPSGRLNADGLERERRTVVNRNVRTFSVSKLWVASTSAFPSLGSANPTLTHIMLTRRFGDGL